MFYLLGREMPEGIIPLMDSGLLRRVPLIIHSIYIYIYLVLILIFNDIVTDFI